MNAAITPVRFVERRTTEQHDTRDGPRIWVTEYWNDGHVTKRVMGPAETAAHLTALGKTRL